MPNLVSIEVQTCDNELYIIATQPTGSAELLHMKSGYSQSAVTTVYPPAILAAGTYDIVFVGIDWGGAVSFTGVLTYDDTSTANFNLSQAAGSVYTQEFPQQVLAAP